MRFQSSCTVLKVTKLEPHPSPHIHTLNNTLYLLRCSGITEEKLNRTLGDSADLANLAAPLFLSTTVISSPWKHGYLWVSLWFIPQGVDSGRQDGEKHICSLACLERHQVKPWNSIPPLPANICICNIGGDGKRRSAVVKGSIHVKDLEPCLAEKAATHRALCRARGWQPQLFDGAFKSISLSWIRNE